jgi:hypothetical protein
MPLDINVPFSPFEVYDHQLPFFIKHEVLGLNIPIAVATVMNELQYFENVDEDGFGWQPYDVALVLLQYYVAGVFSFIVEQPVDTRPLSYRNVLPQSIVDLYYGIEALWSILDHYRLRIALGISVKNGSIFRTL